MEEEEEKPSSSTLFARDFGAKVDKEHPDTVDPIDSLVQSGM